MNPAGEWSRPELDDDVAGAVAAAAGAAPEACSSCLCRPGMKSCCRCGCCCASRPVSHDGGCQLDMTWMNIIKHAWC